MQFEQLQMLFERAGWVMLGILTLLFLIWRVSGHLMKQRLRQLRHQRRAAAHPSAGIHQQKV
jgi:hypothetical protein